MPRHDAQIRLASRLLRPGVLDQTYVKHVLQRLRAAREAEPPSELVAADIIATRRGMPQAAMGTVALDLIRSSSEQMLSTSAIENRLSGPCARSLKGGS